MNIPIDHRVFTATSVVAQIQVKVLELVLFESITLEISYIDVNGTYVYHQDLPRSITLEKEEYALWGQDDSFITQKVLEKLGLDLPQ